MKRFTCIKICLALCLSGPALFAQPETWTGYSLTPNDLDSVRSLSIKPALHNSQNLNTFFIGGTFQLYDNDELIDLKYLSAFDGSEFQYLDIGTFDGIPFLQEGYGYNVYFIDDYFDGIVYASQFKTFGPEGPLMSNIRLFYYDGFDHQVLFDFDSMESEPRIVVRNDVIYIAGLRHNGELDFLKYEGGELLPAFASEPDVTPSLAGVTGMNWFQDKWYFVIKIYEEDGGLGTAFLAYDGDTWNPVADANGNSPSTGVRRMWNYNDLLVISSSSSNAEDLNLPSGSGNGLLFFDGFNFTAPSSLLQWTNSTSGTVIGDAVVIDDDLYVLGNFFYGSSGESINAIAKWNGSQWCGLQVDWDWFEGFQATTLGVYNGRIMHVRSGWSMVDAFVHDGETFAPCTVPLDIEEIERPSGVLNAFPNPANRTLTVTLNDHNPQGVIELHIHDLHGRIIYRQNHPELVNGEARIEVNHLPAGLYTLHCTVDGVWVDAVKIVVE